MRLSNRVLQQLMREIRRTILEDIAEALHNLGVTSGNKIDGGTIIGDVPMGSAKIIVQKDGTEVARTFIMNFVGDGFVVDWDATNNRVNISNPLAVPPFTIVDYSLNDVTNIAGDYVVVS